MVVGIFNPSTSEEEAGRAMWVWEQPGLHNEFQVDWDYNVGAYLKTKSELKGSLLMST